MTLLLSLGCAQTSTSILLWRACWWRREINIGFIVLTICLLHYLVKTRLVVIPLFSLILLTQFPKPVSIFLDHEILVLDLLLLQLLPFSLSLKLLDVIIRYRFVLLLLIFEPLLLILSQVLLQLFDVFLSQTFFFLGDVTVSTVFHF